MKIAVGLSGGVDSSVVAHLLKEQGHEVIGVRMNLFSNQGTKEDEDAREVARYLGIQYRSIGMEDVYKEKVIQYIKEEYLAGRTPNPCIICNRYVKFGIFLDKLTESGIEFDKFATGHYALIEKDLKNDRYILKKGSNSDKDQAYFLSLLNQEQLSKIIFPLGAMNKKDVKAIAAKAGLFTAQKRESQDLCSGDYRDFIDNGGVQGAFVHKDGTILGKHLGIENYTIGQRRGLSLSSPGEPYYVIELDRNNNNVIIGYNEDLLSSSMEIGPIFWGAIVNPPLPLEATVKIRYRDDGVKATIVKKTDNGNYLVEFSKERRAVTPGQLSVFYRDDTVLGAAFIEKQEMRASLN